MPARFVLFRQRQSYSIKKIRKNGYARAIFAEKLETCSTFRLLSLHSFACVLLVLDDLTLFRTFIYQSYELSILFSTNLSKKCATSAYDYSKLLLIEVFNKKFHSWRQVVKLTSLFLSLDHC